MTARRTKTEYKVTLEVPEGARKGTKQQLKLPDPPPHDDILGNCAWLTAVLHLDPKYPITFGKWYGLRGGRGAIVLEREGTESISIEPASSILNVGRFMEQLMFTRITTDREPYPYTNHHCRTISHVIHRLCDSTNAISERDETMSALLALIADARRVDGFTLYGTTPQRYEMLEALQRDNGKRAHQLEPWERRYAVDTTTGEYVVPADELRAFMRKQFGSAISRGWLEGRLEKVGWKQQHLTARPEGRGSKQGERYIWRGELED